MKQVQAPEHSGSFLVSCIQRYDAMMTDMSLHKRKGIERLEEIECCFQIATHYQQILLSELSYYEFENIKDEVFFFKKIKPLFQAEIEYYGLCNYAEIFKHGLNVDGEKDLLKFYQKEHLRLEKFGKEYCAFYNYVKEGICVMDEVWFTRLGNDKTKSAFDGLMGTYLALEKYVRMVGEEIKVLEKERIDD